MWAKSNPIPLAQQCVSQPPLELTSARNQGPFWFPLKIGRRFLNHNPLWFFIKGCYFSAPPLLRGYPVFSHVTIGCWNQVAFWMGSEGNNFGASASVGFQDPCDPSIGGCWVRTCCMVVRKSGINSPVEGKVVFSPMICKVFCYITGGCLGFLNHQQ